MAEAIGGEGGGGNWLTGLLDNQWVQGGGLALGAGSDIYALIQRYQQQQALDRIREILSNPSKLSAFIAKLYRPMSAAENAAVNRDLSANWAARTGGAPGGAQAAFASNALAGIESQRYQAAVQSALQALTGASGAGGQGPQAPTGNLGAILNALMKIRAQQPAKETGIANFPTSSSGVWDDPSAWGGAPVTGTGPQYGPFPSGA